MTIQVAVQHEGIGCGKSAARTDEVVSFLSARLELVQYGVLITKPEDRVHLFAINSRRKTGKLRKRPAPGEVGVVTFVQFETGDAEVDELLAMIVAEDPACRLTGEIGHQPAPYAIVP